MLNVKTFKDKNSLIPQKIDFLQEIMKTFFFIYIDIVTLQSAKHVDLKQKDWNKFETFLTYHPTNNDFTDELRLQISTSTFRVKTVKHPQLLTSSLPPPSGLDFSTHLQRTRFRSCRLTTTNLTM